MKTAKHSPVSTDYSPIYSNDTIRSLVVSNLIVCNSSGSKANVWLHVLSSPTDPPSPDNALLFSFNMNSDSFQELFTGGIINPGESLVAKTDTRNSISIRLSGLLE